MSPRAAEIMAEADLLLAEDTRRTMKLVPQEEGKSTSYNDVNAREGFP
jgi:16S rRNA C1402 (ribose-2'-O) methylase RsmI